MFLRLCCLVGCLLLGLGAANASLYQVNGTFSNGASLTGTIGLDRGVLLSVDLNANGSIPGDNATHWTGSPIFCTGSCAPVSSGPSASSTYVAGLFSVRETYLPLSQTYALAFNGGGSLAYLNLDFTLAASGLIMAGQVFDPACSGASCLGSVSLTGGSVSATPLPGALPLFLSGLVCVGLFGWIRRRSQAAPCLAA
jgi:hypothetical protein